MHVFHVAIGFHPQFIITYVPSLTLYGLKNVDGCKICATIVIKFAEPTQNQLQVSSINTIRTHNNNLII